MIRLFEKFFEALFRIMGCLGIGQAVPHLSQPRDELDRVMLASLCFLESDWLLIDAEGAIGVFMMAGYGDVPDALLRLGEEGIERYKEDLISALTKEWGEDYVDQAGKRGMFIYDWTDRAHGHYVRQFSPSEPVLADELRTLLDPFASAIPNVPVRFEECESIDLSDLIDCRNHSDVPSG